MADSRVFQKVLPKVLIDARMVGPVLHGMARYVTLLARGLEEVRAEGGLSYEPVFIIQPGFRQQVPLSPLLAFETVECGAKFLSPAEMLALPRLLSRYRAAVYHSPTFSSLPTCPCPWIVTVHDLNHLYFGNVAQKFYYRFLLKPFVRGAAAVMTVSRFSRDELAAWASIPAACIDIASNAITPELAWEVPKEEIEKVLAGFGLQRGRYFFCLANAKPHKNVKMLTEAYAAFRQQKTDRAAWPLALSMNGFAGDGLVSLGSLGEFEARALMAGAGALLSPSTYEGFGLPPVEAAAQGVPVVAASIPPHKEGLEVLRDGEVQWVDPRDFHGWVNAFHRVERGEVLAPSEESRKALLEKFTPFALGRHMDHVYRDVLNKQK